MICFRQQLYAEFSIVFAHIHIWEQNGSDHYLVKLTNLNKMKDEQDIHNNLIKSNNDILSPSESLELFDDLSVEMAWTMLKYDGWTWQTTTTNCKILNESQGIYGCYENFNTISEHTAENHSLEYLNAIIYCVAPAVGIIIGIKFRRSYNSLRSELMIPMWERCLWKKIGALRKDIDKLREYHKWVNTRKFEKGMENIMKMNR